MDLRPATWSDRNLLYEWRRQDEDTAEWWKGVRVTMESHNTWLKPRLNSPLCEIWIGWDNAPAINHNGDITKELRPVGMVRIDSNGEIVVNVDVKYRRRGFGTRLVKEALARTVHTRVKASVDSQNTAGVRTLAAAGFDSRPDVEFYICRLS